MSFRWQVSDDLIVDDAIGMNHQEGEEVSGNGTVDIHREERTHEVGHVDFIHIHQRLTAVAEIFSSRPST